MRDYGVGSKFNFNLRLRQLVYLALCVLEILLAFRLGMKLLGANSGNAFVSFIYSVSGVFVFPFSGIFKPMSMDHFLKINSVLELSTIVAMLAYAIVAWIIVKLIRLGRSSGNY
jgi:hypothetical protein